MSPPTLKDIFEAGERIIQAPVNGELPNREAVGKEMLEYISKFDFANNPEWRKFAEQTDASVPYTRNLVYESEKLCVLILDWNKNVKSAPHDHAGSHGWVMCLDGEVTEKRFTPDTEMKQTAVTVVKPGMATYIHDSMAYHQICETSGGNSVSLHVYSPPIKDCLIFDENSKEAKKVTMKYNTMPDENGNPIVC
eukprot:TRINITY_DN34977_c0_g1_i1.p1 TRINITY_DN34977_c0_g1~~TRINITY_DN34977_c0_g1_i1.p1  ORF type:complete len:194 (+),score=55.18 TRINITY_DN34977_c0_g1_i1:84-665(+)